MARHFFGDQPGDFVVSVVGTTPVVVGNAIGQVWSAKSGGSHLTDLLASDGVTVITQITSAVNGRLGFYGPDGVTSCWVDFGAGRFFVASSDFFSQNDSPGSGLVAANRVTASRDLTAADAGRPLDVYSATDITLTIPPGLPEMFTEVAQRGAGRVTLIGGSGVALAHPSDQTTTIRKRNGVVGLRRCSDVASNLPTGALLDLDPDSISGSNGAAVSSVTNLGSLTGTIAQATTGKQPTLATNAVNGHKAITFDGTTDTLALGGGLLDLARNRTALTAYVVTDFTAAVSGIRTLLGLAVGTGSTSRLYIQRTAELKYQIGGRRLDADASSQFITSTGDVPYAAWLIITARFNWSAAGTYMYKDGSELANDTTWLTSGSTSNTASTAGAIGSNASGASEFWYGRIARMMVFGTDHDATSRAAVHSMLQSTYGVNVADYAGITDEWLLSGDLELA